MTTKEIEETVMKKHRSILGAFLLCATLIGGFVAGRAHAAQTHMAAARNHLRSARQELQQAMTDKGGHREKAIGIVDRAIGEVDAGMEYARTH
jgi:hypothetical protein